MDVLIREEQEKDYKLIEDLVYMAFKTAEHADGDEHNLVSRLRKSDCYIKELSLVAELNGKIVGHIMTSKLYIKDGNKETLSSAIAPVAVVPKLQRAGIGSKLIKETLKIAKENGYKSMFVLGSEKYYPRFGFIESSLFGIEPPFEVPSENFMAIELKEDSLRGVKGHIIYAKEFY